MNDYKYLLLISMINYYGHKLWKFDEVKTFKTSNNIWKFQKDAFESDNLT